MCCYRLVTAHFVNMKKTKRLNCLSYALIFWNDNPNYILLYNSNHVINVPAGTEVVGFLGLEEFGIDYFLSSFRELTKTDKKLLNKYFLNINNNRNERN